MINVVEQNIISLTIVTSRDNFSRVYVINGVNNLEKNINIVKDVFSRNDVNDFLLGFKQIINEMGSEVTENKLVDSDWVVAFDNVGENKILLVDLSKLSDNLYLLYISKSIWTNPRDSSEKQVSFEAHFYAREGVIKEFQRVLIIRGNLIYDAPLKK